MVGKMLQKRESVELGSCCAKSFGEFEYGLFLKALSGHRGILNEKFENSIERTKLPWRHSIPYRTHVKDIHVDNLVIVSFKVQYRNLPLQDNGLIQLRRIQFEQTGGVLRRLQMRKYNRFSSQRCDLGRESSCPSTYTHPRSLD